MCPVARHVYPCTHEQTRTTQANYAIVWHALHICFLQYLYLSIAHTYTIQRISGRQVTDTMENLFYFSFLHYRHFFLILSLTLSLSLSLSFDPLLSLFRFCWLSVELCILWPCSLYRPTVTLLCAIE